MLSWSVRVSGVDSASGSSPRTAHAAQRGIKDSLLNDSKLVLTFTSGLPDQHRPGQCHIFGQFSAEAFLNLFSGSKESFQQKLKSKTFRTATTSLTPSPRCALSL